MKYAIKSKIWIELDGKPVLGEGRVRLLKAIDHTGSLSQAAKSLGISYKKAWTLVDSINSNAKEPVLIRSVGGAKGGGTRLTEYGRSLVECFDQIREDCRDYLDTQENISIL